MSAGSDPSARPTGAGRGACSRRRPVGECDPRSEERSVSVGELSSESRGAAEAIDIIDEDPGVPAIGAAG